MSDTEPMSPACYDPQIPYLLSFIPKNRSAVILDAGCGSGKFLKLLRDHGYSNLFGIDLIEPQHKKAFHFKRASIEELPYADGTFDFVISFSVIHFASDLSVALGELRRVMKKGGTLIITAHTKYSVHTIWRRVKMRFGGKSVLHLKNANFFSSQFYVKKLLQHGFELVLRDGFFLFKYRCAKILDKLKLTRTTPSILQHKVAGTSSFGSFRAFFGYHSVIVAIAK